MNYYVTIRKSHRIYITEFWYLKDLRWEKKTEVIPISDILGWLIHNDRQD